MTLDPDYIPPQWNPTLDEVLALLDQRDADLVRATDEIEGLRAKLAVATVPTACSVHGRHDLTPLQAARVFAVLDGLITDAQQGHSVLGVVCAKELDSEAHDSECYYEHVESLLLGLGLEFPTWEDKVA